MSDQRYSDNDVSKRDIPSFIEPRPPLIQNPFMRPRPQKGTNLLELFEDSEIVESECPELVQVYLRLKPCNVPNTLYEVRSDKCLVTSLDTATAGHGRRTQHNVSRMYTFSKIFGAECDQKEIFETVVKENLKKLSDGHNFTLLTYGASGSGKTYSVMGTVRAPGLVPRSLEYLFRRVDASQQPAYKPAEGGAEKLNNVEQDYELQWVKRLRHVSAPLREKYRRMSAQLHSDLTASSIDLTSRVKHYVWVSFVEIYNEAIYDLLAPPDKRTKLRIREDSSGQVYVKDATQAFVRSGEEAYDVLVAGKHNLVVAATGVHANSSRSHCIFTITMLTETDGAVRTSYVRLCDLAGCERARATRNTGARMQESRAINSSLHVLERCLHILRRKQRARQDALVPYRESKLTRLLGSGLSGARGEAMSMVVTLNPAPQHALETKNVLALAAVAQDIQINNTILASTLETTHDTTVSCSNEVMKLRSDNERLHFELVQSQARIKELMAAMDERQQQVATTMREMVEEAKDLTRQYYEAQMDALKSQYDEIVTEITDRADRAEKEVQPLRNCLEERDEEGFKDTTPPADAISLTDSDHDSDDETEDPFNESLEPVFRKELNKSIAILDKHSDSNSIHTIDNIDEEDETADLEQSKDTLKNDTGNSSHLVDSGLSQNCTHDDTTFEDAKNDIFDAVESNDANVHNDNYYVCNDNVDNESNKNNKTDLRSTYFVKDDTTDEIMFSEGKLKKSNSCRGTYFVKESRNDDIGLPKTSDSNYNVVEKNCNVNTEKNYTEIKMPQKVEKASETLVSKIIKSSQSSDRSLRQFEQLEMASKCEGVSKHNESVFGDIKILKETRNYFEDNIITTKENIKETPDVLPIVKETRSYFDNINVDVAPVTKKLSQIKQIDDDRSSSILKDVVTVNFEPTTIKKLLGESISKPDVLYSMHKTKLAKNHDSMDMFEGLDSPKPEKNKEKVDNIEIAKMSIEKLVLNQKSAKKTHLQKTIKDPEPTPIVKAINDDDIEPTGKSSSVDQPVFKQIEKLSTVEAAQDNIVKKYMIKPITPTTYLMELKPLYSMDNDGMTIKKEIKLEPSSSPDEPNTTEPQNITKVDNTFEEFDNIYKDLTTSRATEFELLVSQEINEPNEKSDAVKTKYNLRNKQRTKKGSDSKDGVILGEYQAKSECKPKKRTLRLRRKNELDDDQDKLNEHTKLKDIANLHNEFSDMTMDLPVAKKEMKDIPSPEESGEENLPPMLGIQSCPATSRRKLFTPRAEPLEESLGWSGDSSERVSVPRPSYHPHLRPRARRKL